MIILGNDKDKFGYYRVGDYKTYSKVDAIELHTRNGIHPHWNFNEEFYSSYNWTMEPTKNLQELYAARARQIRETYDHVVLMCSGGADSTNVLNSFVQNNIQFDEILTYNYWEADNNPESFFHAELTHVMYPLIKKLQEQGIKFKHRDFDMSPLVASILTDRQYRLERGYLSSCFFGIGTVCKSFVRDHVEDYKKLSEQGKKVVFVWASEKPRVYFDGRYNIRFSDVFDNAVNPRTQMLQRENEYDELFYWSPEAVDIVCKQGHIIKNFFKKNKLALEEDVNSEKAVKLPNIEMVFNNNDTQDRLGYRFLIDKLVYPDWNTTTFSVGKGNGPLISPFDGVWNGDNIFGQTTQLLVQHIKSLPEYWLSNPKKIHRGLKLCISPAYYLE
jgi:hypothetical protein